MHYTLSDMIADLTQNAVEAGSSVVLVDIAETESRLEVRIRDNGKGMDSETLKRVTDPFYTDGVKHPGRKVGLGIPFLIQTAADTGGEWDISSVPGEGTVVHACFNLSHIDTPPAGSLPDLFLQILTLPGAFEMKISRKRSGSGISEADIRSYEIVRSELIEALGDIETAGSLALLKEFLNGQENEPDGQDP